METSVNLMKGINGIQQRLKSILGVELDIQELNTLSAQRRQIFKEIPDDLYASKIKNIYHKFKEDNPNEFQLITAQDCIDNIKSMILSFVKDVNTEISNKVNVLWWLDTFIDDCVQDDDFTMDDSEFHKHSIKTFITLLWLSSKNV